MLPIPSPLPWFIPIIGLDTHIGTSAKAVERHRIARDSPAGKSKEPGEHLSAGEAPTTFMIR